jgi:hypothetical protein
MENRKFEFTSKSIKKEPKQDNENFSIDELQKYYQEFMHKYNGIYIFNTAIEDIINDLREKLKEISLEDKNKILEDVNNLIRELKEDYRLNVSFLTAHDKQKYLSVCFYFILAY